MKKFFFVILLSLLTTLPLLAFETGSKNRIIIYADELKLDHTSSFLNVLTPSETEVSGSVGNMLGFERGLTVQNRGPGALSTVNIRGVGAQSASQVLVLLDGVRLNSVLGLGVDLSQIAPSTIEKIEIIRGGESALYGADAVGGVINIVTKKGGNKTQVSLSRQSWNFESSKDHTLSISKGFQGKSLELHLQGFSQQDSGSFPYKNPITGALEKRKNNESFARSLLTKAHWALTPTTHFSLLQESFAEKQRTPGPLNPNGSQSTTYGTQQDLRILTEFKWGWDLSPTETVLVRLPIQNQKLIYRSNTTKDVYGSLAWGPKLHWTFNPHSKHLVSLLAEVSSESLESLSHQENAKRTSWGTVAKDDFFVTEALTLTPVLRFDRASRLYTALSPKMGASYEVTPNISLKSNLSKNFRAPSFNELYSKLVSEYGASLGNPDLKPESSWDGDVGFTAQSASWKWEQAFFTSQVKDLIVWTQASPTLSTYQNIASDKLWGVETSLETKIPGTSNLFGELNYTYLDTHQAYRPKHSLNRKIKWVSDLFQAYIDYQYLSHLNTTSSDKPRLPLTQLVHLGTSVKLSPHLSLSAKVENVFDRSYERIAFYPMPGRIFSFNFTGTL